MDGPPITGVILWSPTEVQKLYAELPSDDGWWICSALARTLAGDRLLIHATTVDRGIVAIFDGATDSFKHPALGYAVYGRPAVVVEPLGDAVLPPILRRNQGRRYLLDDQQDAVPDILKGIAWQDCDDELPRKDDPSWDIRLQDAVWGSETGLSDVVAEDSCAYRQPGYIDPPQREQHPDESRRRMDLFGKDRHGRELVTELKHFCGIDALAQLDRYLAARRAAGRRCAGHLVALSGYSLVVVDLVRRRSDVALWRCWPNGAGRPVFEHIAGPREPVP